MPKHRDFCICRHLQVSTSTE
ncbi:hypothetical protein PENARI_c023G04798 [Penicillium arizonense]|uniref:Uncharacterized protein n=1 Tax=Penicillium arizonense TaxID=1835702 RepID=A0A1F5L7H1_PENAI|nr:hypothetical protein PENARI_c023G04798 [Penicillium arizonense]